MDFSQVEHFARHFDSPDRDAWQLPHEVIRLLQLSQGNVVADIGAGTGYFVPALSSAVGASGVVHALDVEPNMIRYIEKRAAGQGLANVRARVVSTDDPGLPPASVDRILIVNTWHHIDHRSRYAAKLARALRRGGFILVVDFTRESDIGPPDRHRLSASTVVSELAAANLEASVVAEESLPKQYVVRASLP